MSILSQFKQSQNTDFPNVRPSLDLRFALAKKLDPRITFTRGSTGTYFGSDGLMRTAGVNEPRFDHDPITGQSLGLLVEESRINLYTRSDIEGTVGSTPTDMNVPYTSQGQSVVVSTDVFLGPNGQSSKHIKGVQQNDSNIGYFSTSGLTVGQTYCGSIWVYIPSSQAKNFSGKTITFAAESTPSSTNTITASFNTNLVDVWQRSFCVFTAGTSGSIGIVPRTNAVAGSFFYTDCWQLELGRLPTSYIPTTASTVTRSADLVEMTGKNFSSWYNQKEGTIYLETDKLYPGNFDAYRHPYKIDSASNSDQITAYTLPDATTITNYGIVTGGRSIIDYQQINIGSAPTTFKLGQSVNAKYFFFTTSKGTTPPQLSSKSAPNGQNLSLATNMSRLFIGNRGGVAQINSHITRFTYYPIQLTNQQLINLTS